MTVLPFGTQIPIAFLLAIPPNITEVLRITQLIKIVL